MNSKSLQIATSVIGLFVIPILISGCQQYGEVSPKTYEYAKAIFGACRRRDDPRNPRDKVIADLNQRIQQSVDDEEMSAKEAKWLTDILQIAKNGGVKEAAAKARLIMEEQVRR